MVREAAKNDLNSLLELYLYLHEESIPETDKRLFNGCNYFSKWNQEIFFIVVYNTYIRVSSNIESTLFL